jgi:hypothetical protein
VGLLVLLISLLTIAVSSLLPVLPPEIGAWLAP